MDTKNIEVLTHSSIRIRGSLGTVYVDPFKLRDEPHDADIIMVTHEHFDHFSPDDIEKSAKDGTVLVYPESMAEKTAELEGLKLSLFPVAINEKYCAAGLEFETVPAYNIGKNFHTKEAGWVGYILIADGARIYIAGDTDATEEAKAVKADVALIPAGGTYTCEPREAAELANAIRPAVAIPTHYGSVAGDKKDGERFAKEVKPPVKVEIKMQY